MARLTLVIVVPDRLRGRCNHQPRPFQCFAELHRQLRQILRTIVWDEAVLPGGVDQKLNAVIQVDARRWIDSYCRLERSADLPQSSFLDQIQAIRLSFPFRLYGH